MIYFINAYRSNIYPQSDHLYRPKAINEMYLFPEVKLGTEIEIAEWTRELCRRYDDELEKGKYNVLIYSNSHIIFYELRVCIRHMIIEHPQLTVKYYNQPYNHREVFKITVDKHAKLDRWPDGFMDMLDKQLDVLL